MTALGHRQARGRKTMGSDLQPEDYHALAAFRYAMRKFLRYSKEALAAGAQLTPEQYEALLAIKVRSASKGITVGDLSERFASQASYRRQSD